MAYTWKRNNIGDPPNNPYIKYMVQDNLKDSPKYDYIPKSREDITARDNVERLLALKKLQEEASKKQTYIGPASTVSEKIRQQWRNNAMLKQATIDAGKYSTTSHTFYPHLQDNPELAGTMAMASGEDLTFKLPQNLASGVLLGITGLPKLTENVVAEGTDIASAVKPAIQNFFKNKYVNTAFASQAAYNTPELVKKTYNAWSSPAYTDEGSWRNKIMAPAELALNTAMMYPALGGMKTVANDVGLNKVLPFLTEKKYTTLLDGSKYIPKFNVSQSDVAANTRWIKKDLPGLHLKSTMSGGPIENIIEPSTGMINTQQALAIIGKESGGQQKLQLVREALGNNIPLKMDYNVFRSKIQNKLIPLNKDIVSHSSNYGLNNIKYGVAKLENYNRSIEFTKQAIASKKELISKAKSLNVDGGDELISKFEKELLENEQHLLKLETEIKNIPIENKTIVFSNKDIFPIGSSNHGNPKETLGHTHYVITPDDPTNFKITQLQSDWGQHTSIGKTSKEEQIKYLNDAVKYGEGKNLVSYLDDIRNYQKELPNYNQKQLLQKNHQERFLQESIDYALKNPNIKTISLPTRETAAKIQRYKPINFERIDANTTKSTYYPEHETILKKYDKYPDILKKLNIETNSHIDKQGNSWISLDADKLRKTFKEIKALGIIPGVAVSGGLTYKWKKNEE